MTNSKLFEKFKIQLQELIRAYNPALTKEVSWSESTELITRFRSAVYRITPYNSAYQKQFDEIMDNEKLFITDKLDLLYGVVKSLYYDLSNGYLENLSEIIHAETFADFLEMSQHLLDEGYKDAAAVIAGSSLESHMRKLSEKFGLDIEYESDSNIRTKKADRINAELSKLGAYSKLDQKNLTAWLDLRNKAAHGHYEEYTKEQVGNMISGIRDFLLRNPA